MSDIYGEPRRSCSALVALILAAGVAVPALAAENAAPAVQNAAGTGAACRGSAPAPCLAGGQLTRRHRVAPRFSSPRHVHDAGARPVLRRNGPAENVLGTVVQSFIVLGCSAVEWVLVGLQHGVRPRREGSHPGTSPGSVSPGVGTAPFKEYAAPSPIRRS